LPSSLLATAIVHLKLILPRDRNYFSKTETLLAARNMRICW